MVLEEGLDTSGLPETLKEDFNELDRLEGQYRVTSCLMEVGDLEDLSPGKEPPCGFCNVNHMSKYWTELVEDHKAIITFSKVEVGSALYKKGVRWTEIMESESMGKYDGEHMVLGHTNFHQHTQWINNIDFISMNKLIIPFSSIFRLGYVDGRTLRQDTWYSWRRRYWEAARPGMYRQMWKLDKEGNFTSIRQALIHCPQCEEVKQIVQTVLTERVKFKVGGPTDGTDPN